MRHPRNLLAFAPTKHIVHRSRIAMIAAALLLGVSVGASAANASSNTPASAVAQIKSVYRAVLSAEYFGPASELCSNLTAKGLAQFTTAAGGGSCLHAFDELRHALTNKIPDEDNTGYTPSQWRGLVVEILDHLKVTVHGTHATAIGGESGIPGQTALVDKNGHWLFNDFPPSVSS
jgi:hypothetical protein